MPDVVCHFHALCEGLADLELRGALPTRQEERMWTDGLQALADDFDAPLPEEILKSFHGGE